MSMESRRLLRRARWLMWVDGAMVLVRAPLRLLIFGGQLVYLLFCALSWGVILWVLGEKHVGALKLLLIVLSLGVWAVLFSFFYSFWVVQGV